MATPAVDTLRQRIKHYSDRGVLQGFSESQNRRGKTTFKFRWLLGHEFSLTLDPAKGELKVSNLLPCIVNRSFIDLDLRKFIAARTDTKLPTHRRLDAARATLIYTNRRHYVSLVMSPQKDQYAYAIKTLFTILNDLFAYLHLYHIDYLQRNFGVPEE